MKSFMFVACLAWLGMALPVHAAESAKTTTPQSQKGTSDAGKKSAGDEKREAKPAEKTKAGSGKPKESSGSSLKNGWNRFTHDVKQGRKKPACTPEQKSLKQC